MTLLLCATIASHSCVCGGGGGAPPGCGGEGDPTGEGEGEGEVGEGEGEGEGCTSLSLAPTEAAFDSVALDSSSEALTFTITNACSDASTGTVSAITSGDFAITGADCGPSLAPGESCSVSATFSPTAVGLRNGTLAITTELGFFADAALSGTGLGVVLSMAPTSLAFGDGCVGGGSAACGDTIPPDLDVVVTNDGTAPSDAIVVEIDGAEFEIVDNECDVLEPGVSCTVTVRFVPTTNGNAAATLTVSDGFADDVTTSLSGLGLFCNDDTSVAPAIAAFDDTVVGATSAATTFTISNGDDGGITCTSFLGGADATSFSLTSNGCDATTLEPGASCVIDVVFAPASPGPNTATLQADCSPCGNFVSAVLSGTGL